MNIIFKGSPNYGKRTKPIKKILVHWFGVGTLESANNRFQNPKNQTSAHYGISQGRVWQWVKESDVAWHSGVFAVNAESIGIEHDANPKQPLSEQDYLLSAQLIGEICKRHNLPVNRQTIIGHREVKNTACPGTIDINKIIKLIKGMNQTKVVLSKDGKTLYEARPIATSFEEYKKQASVEGITIPDPIPSADSL